MTQKLLSDEELCEKLEDISEYLGCNDMELKNEIIPLINTQKRLYAESVINKTDTIENEGEPETFKHMLTVIVIMFGDAREYDNERSEKLNKEAFEYAESWLKVNKSEQKARIK